MADPTDETARVSVQCSSTVQADPGDLLQAHLVRAWLRGVPDGAHIGAITHEHGGQRDPVIVTVGLTAEWSEVRDA